MINNAIQISGGYVQKNNWMQVIIIQLLQSLSKESIDTHYFRKIGNLKRLINFVRLLFGPENEIWSA